MADATTVGSVSVDVVPSAEGFGKKMAAQIEPQAKSLGEKIGRAIADKIADSIKKGLGEGFAGSETISKQKGKDSGQKFGGEFARTARTRIEAALNSLPAADVALDLSKADRQMNELRARLKALGDKRIGIEIEEADAFAEIAEIQAALTVLGNESPSVEVKVNTGAAIAELAAFRASAELLTAGSSGGSGAGGLAKIKSLAAGAGSGLAAMASALGPLVIGAAIAVPVLITLTTALLGITAALLVPIGVAAGGLTLFGILSGFAIKNVLETSKEIDKLKKKADSLKDGSKKDAVLANIKDLEKSLTASQRAFLKAKNGLSGAFDKLIDGKAGKSIFAPLASGMNLLAKIMPKLEPLITAVSSALTDLLDAAGKKVDGGGFTKFIAHMADLAGPSIKAIASIIGSITRAFGGLFSAATGTGMSAIDGMADGLRRLADYLTTGKGQYQMQEFFQWLKDNGPGILKAIGQISTYIGHAIMVMMAIGPPIFSLFGRIASVISAWYTGVVRPVFSAVANAFSLIGRAFVSVYNSMIGPALSWIITAVSKVLRVFGIMLGALGKIPGGKFQWARDAAKAMNDASREAAGLSAAVKRIPEKIRIGATTDFQAAYDAINRLNAKARKAGNGVHYTNGTGGGQRAFAKGTNYSPAGMALVGEEGPELVNLPEGSQVIPTNRTMAMMRNIAAPAAAASSQRPITMNGSIVGVLREIANGEASLVLNDQLAFAGTTGRMYS